MSAISRGGGSVPPSLQLHHTHPPCRQVVRPPLGVAREWPGETREWPGSGPGVKHRGSLYNLLALLANSPHITWKDKGLSGAFTKDLSRNNATLEIVQKPFKNIAKTHLSCLAQGEAGSHLRETMEN